MPPKIFNNDVIHPELSYAVGGVLFETQDRLGRFCREKQYCDIIEALLLEQKIPYVREAEIVLEGLQNKADFIVNDRILIEVKAKSALERIDYAQVKRYLEARNLKLGILVNFRNKYVKPIRILNSKYRERVNSQSSRNS